MIIPIVLSPVSAPLESKIEFPPQLAKLGSNEVVLLELQGSFHVEGDNSGQMIGKLQMESEGSKPTLRVGHHLLEGKLVNLSKPLAVLVKNTDSPTSSDAKRNQDEASTDISYNVMAVVKRKLLFSKRPLPIVGLSSVAVVLEDANSLPKKS